MSSSTSISDAGWRRLLWRYALWTMVFGLMLGAAAIMLDPYDTGRFALFGEYGVLPVGPRLAAAGLGRQPQFDTAIIGNSTMQLIDPSRLDLGSHRAVSLAIPGTGPREQLSVAAWFLRHHADTPRRILIIGISNRWCEANQAPELTHPFPFWLYGTDTGAYLINMMQFQSIESAGRKIRLMLGRTQSLRADGYRDYDAGRAWDRAAFLTRIASTGDREEPKLDAAPPYHFEAAALLKDFLAQIPPDTTVVLVMPPQFRPDRGGNMEIQQNACRTAFGDLAAQYPSTRLINFLARVDLTTREEDYWDRHHYRTRVARAMEEKIRRMLKEDLYIH